MDENQRLLSHENVVYNGTEAIAINSSKWKKKVPVFFVLFTETLERLAFYGLLCNMVLSLNSNPFSWSSYNASHAVMIFMGLSYIVTIFGGWLSDSLLGKFWTVVIFFMLYFSGSLIWTGLYWNEDHLICNNTSPSRMLCGSAQQNHTEPVPIHLETCSSAIFMTLALIAVGYGCVRVNVVPFGAQQVEDQGRLSLRTYFNWLYWCINVGSLVGFGIFGYVQQDVSYFYGYVGPSSALLLAWLIFVAGSHTYKKRFYVEGSPLKGIATVICSSLKTFCTQTWQCIQDRRRASDSMSCLEKSSEANGGKCSIEDVQNTKAVLKVLLFFLCLVPYWITYYQTQTTFLIQGMHMRLDFNRTNSSNIDDDESFKVPISWLSLFNVVFVILIVPLLDRVIYPCLDSVKFNLSLRFRILLGMSFSTIAMLVAGYLERIRLKQYWGEDNAGHPYVQKIACTLYHAADLCILWQIPQYLLIAFSEVFTSIASLEMAYVCAPKCVQSLLIGFYYCIQGVGSLVGSLVMLSFQGVWFHHYDFGNINCKRSPFLPDSSKDPESSCHLDYYFYILAGVQVFGILVFTSVAYIMDIGGPSLLKNQRKSVAKRDS